MKKSRLVTERGVPDRIQCDNVTEFISRAFWTSGPMKRESPWRLPSKGWAALIRKPHIGLRSAAMIRKVYEVDPMICPTCGVRMKVVAFLTEVAVVDRIIDHLKLGFVAAKPQPC